MTAVDFARKLIARSMRYKLTMPQFGVLLCLASGIKTGTKISSSLNVNKGSFVAVLKSLVSNGYVTISPAGIYELTTAAQVELCDIFNFKSKWK